MPGGERPGGRYEKLEQEVVSFAHRYTCTIAESRKFLKEKALCEQGVEILYESSVCGVYLEENSVIGLRVLTNRGLVDYGASIKLYIPHRSITPCGVTTGRYVLFDKLEFI